MLLDKLLNTSISFWSEEKRVAASGPQHDTPTLQPAVKIQCLFA